MRLRILKREKVQHLFRPALVMTEDGLKARWGRGRHYPLERVPPPDLQPTRESAGLMSLTNKGDGRTLRDEQGTAALPQQRRRRRGQSPGSPPSPGIQKTRTSGSPARPKLLRAHASAERPASARDRIAQTAAYIAAGDVVACVALALIHAPELAITAVAGIGVAALTTLTVYLGRR